MASNIQELPEHKEKHRAPHVPWGTAHSSPRCSSQREQPCEKMQACPTPCTSAHLELGAWFAYGDVSQSLASETLRLILRRNRIAHLILEAFLTSIYGYFADRRRDLGKRNGLQYEQA